MGANRLGRLPDSFFKADARAAPLAHIGLAGGDGQSGAPPRNPGDFDDIYKVTAHPVNVVQLRPPPFLKPAASEIALPANTNRTRITALLFDDQKVLIDRRIERARENGSSLNRSQVLRAFIDGFLDSGIDLSIAGDETVLRTVLTKRLSGKK